MYVMSYEAQNRVVPDSCCKTVTHQCGQRDHPSNIYKVEVGVKVNIGLIPTEPRM